MKNLEPIHTDAAPMRSGSTYPEPYKSRMGNASWRPLAEVFGLTQFGVNLETLPPGAQSGLRHWHDLEDEFVYVTAGELVLRTDDGERTLSPGMCIGFKAGDNNAHHLVNRCAVDAQFIVIGTREPDDVAFYPDDDLAWSKSEAGYVAVHNNVYLRIDISPFTTLGELFWHIHCGEISQSPEACCSSVHDAVIPPSTIYTPSLRYRLSSLARKSIRLATSPGTA